MKMKTISFALGLALLLGTASGVNAQEVKKMFDFEALNFYSAEGTKSRVDIYIEIPLGNFEFKRSKDDKSKFVTSFDLTIDVKDQNGSSAYNNVSKEDLVTTETKQEYLQENSQIIAKNLFLTPGKYKMKLSVYENSTKRHSEIEKDIVVRDFLADPFSISDVMLVSKITETNGRKYITPSVSNEVGSLDTFNLFFYVYKNNTDQTIDITCKVFDGDKKVIFSSNDAVSVIDGNFQNQFIIPVPTATMTYGKYTVEISAANKQLSVQSNSQFSLGNAEFPFSLNDIDKLIDQLQYIAKESESDYMRAGKTVAEKQKRFMEFWKSKDPNPLTRRNEVMNEYYRRLFYANKHFSTTYTEGWKTDMGMVFIIFDAPSNIDRHPYDMDSKPFEIWDYYDLNKQFTFVDNSGFGDYRLITPIWDTFRYQRD